MKIVDFNPTVNPDSASIAKKTPADIQLSTIDISGSGYTASMDPTLTTKEIKLNYYGNGIVLELDRYTGEGAVNIPEGFTKPKVTGTIYYTPIYSEKLNYQTWLNTINRNFQELN